jgi:hypothetical protein
MTSELTSAQVVAVAQKLERLIVRLETYDDQGELTASILQKFQEALDKLADEYQYDIRLGEKRSLFYELQALILLAKGDEKNAELAMEGAANISGNPPGFVSRAAKKWYKNKLTSSFEDEATSPPDSKQKFSGKIEGWLAFYSLAFVAAPILLIIDLAGSMNTLDGLQNTEYYTQLNNILNFARIYDVIQLVSLTIFGYLFFAKKRVTRLWAIAHTVFVILGGFAIYVMMSDFYTTNNIPPDADTQPIITAGTFVWLFYWIFSKRVKATFVK